MNLMMLSIMAYTKNKPNVDSFQKSNFPFSIYFYCFFACCDFLLTCDTSCSEVLKHPVFTVKSSPFCQIPCNLQVMRQAAVLKVKVALASKEVDPVVVMMWFSSLGFRNWI